MTDLERQLTTALERLSVQYETEQRRHSGQIEAAAAAGRSLAAASRAAERAGDGLDRILRHLRRRARERVEMTRRLMERIRPPGPDRDSGPSR